MRSGVRHREALNEVLAGRLRTLPADEVAAAMRTGKVPFGFVNDMAAVFKQPVARDQCFDDGLGVRSVALSGDIEGRRDLTAPPHLDADRAEVVAWLEAREADS